MADHDVATGAMPGIEELLRRDAEQNPCAPPPETLLRAMNRLAPHAHLACLKAASAHKRRAERRVMTVACLLATALLSMAAYLYLAFGLSALMNLMIPLGGFAALALLLLPLIEYLRAHPAHHHP